jgi:hypothetical protein
MPNGENAAVQKPTAAAQKPPSAVQKPPLTDAEVSAAAGDASRFIIITPETTAGKRFRPSDWSDRLIGALHILGEEEFEKYSEYVHQVNYGGAKCVMIDRRLEDADARMFRFFMRFAADNDLVTAAADNENACRDEPQKTIDGASA